MLNREDKFWLVSLAKTIIWALGYLISGHDMRVRERQFKEELDELLDQ